MAENENSAPGNIISLDVAARLLEIGQERIRQLMRDGYIPRSERGKVSLVGAVQGYCRFLKELAAKQTKTAADSEVRQERAREIRLRNEARTRELIPTEEATEALDYLVGVVLEVLSGLPARYTRDLGDRRKLEAVCYACQKEISEALAAAIVSARTGKDLPNSGSANDT